MSDIPDTLLQGSLPQGPLLFFVEDRRRRLIEALIPIGIFTIVLALVSWGIARAAGQAPWRATVFLCCVLVFFAYAELHMILSTFHLIRPGPALILYAEGIYDRRVSKSIIPWNQFSRMRHQRMSLQNWWMLHFYARNPTIVRRQMRLIHRLPSLINQLSGHGTYIVNFHDLDPGADVALSYIIPKLREHGADPGSPAIVKNLPGSSSIE